MTRRLLILTSVVFLTGCQTMREMGGFPEKVADLVSGETPRKSRDKMENGQLPDERRQGINELADRRFGKDPLYTLRYSQIAENDPDYSVKATAIRALNRARDRKSTPLFIKFLSDEHAEVRLEAVKALANLPDPNATQPLLSIVRNENETRDVRIAAAEALKHYRTLEVARALIAQLGGKDFGVAWQSRESLKLLTRRDLEFDETAWLNFVTGPTKPFG